tara:strand:+ start:58575 stop:58724 length:150 start_codon:yes stop_codon:yes gene_type:complete
MSPASDWGQEANLIRITDAYIMILYFIVHDDADASITQQSGPATLRFQP